MATAAARPTRATTRLASAVDWATASHGRALLLLALVALLAILPGFAAIPPVDRDEALFAQISKQMIETGDYVDLRYQAQDFYKKPAGINWLQAMVVESAMGLGYPDALRAIWLYRIPSLLGALGAVLLTYWAALAFVGRRPAFLAALMFAVSPMLGLQGHLARTDAVLLAAFVAVLGSMGRVYLAARRGMPAAPGEWISAAIFWTSLAAGFLLKGPFIILFAGLVGVTLVILDRSVGWIWRLKPLVGIAWLLLLVLPWLLAIVQRSGMSFFAESIGHDMLGKVVMGQELHGAPPGYYLVLFIATFWPGSALSLPALPHIFANRRTDWARFLLAWILPAWIIFELVPTKLPHYVLTLYPAIAILTAEAMVADRLSRNRWLVAGVFSFFLLPLLVGIGAIAALMYIAGNLGLAAWPFALGAIAFGYLAWRRYRSEGAEPALLRASAASILLVAAIYGFVFPAMRPLFPAVMAAEAVRGSGCADPQAVMAGFEEPSYVFLLGTRTQFMDPYGAIHFLQGGPCRFALIDARWEASVLQRAQLLGLKMQVLPRIEGFNPSHGNRLTILVYRSPD